MSWFWAGVVGAVIVLCGAIVLTYLYMKLVCDTIARLAGWNRPKR